MRWIGVIILVVGFLSFIALPAAASLWREQPGGLEFPLGAMEGVAVDSTGRIYVGSGSYGRVQVYDSSGRFLHGWGVNAGGGEFRMCVDENDLIHIGTARFMWHGVYDRAGQLLEESTGSDLFQEIGAEADSRFTTDDGTVYQRNDAWIIWPQIVRAAPDGSTTVMVTSPWYLWVFMGPLPAIFVPGFGAILIVLANARRQGRLDLIRWRGRHLQSAIPTSDESSATQGLSAPPAADSNGTS